MATKLELLQHEALHVAREYILEEPFVRADVLGRIDAALAAFEAQQKREDRRESAARALYYAAHWTPDRDVDAGALWTEVRDAFGFEPGRAPPPSAERRMECACGHDRKVHAGVAIIDGRTHCLVDGCRCRAFKSEPPPSAESRPCVNDEDCDHEPCCFDVPSAESNIAGPARSLDAGVSRGEGESTERPSPVQACTSGTSPSAESKEEHFCPVCGDELPSHTPNCGTDEEDDGALGDAPGDPVFVDPADAGCDAGPGYEPSADTCPECGNTGYYTAPALSDLPCPRGCKAKETKP